jgi:hypothetical protein
VIDKDELLRKAEELRRSAESVKHLDEAVESRSNVGKRQNLAEAIKQVQVNYLYTSQAKVAREAGTINDELIKSVNGRLLPDLLNIANLRDQYEGTPNWDTAGERRLLAGECFTRIDLLKRSILEGRLDHLLSNHAEILVHGVMGYNGELLEVLGIDPNQGETYRRITEPRSDQTEAGSEETSQFKDASYITAGALIAVGINKITDRIPKPPTPPPPDTAEDFTSTPKKSARLIRIVPGGVGIVGYTLTEEIASYMGLEKETRGALVIGVLPNSIAEKAGLRAGTTPAVLDGIKCMLGGDIIIAVEDKTINNMRELTEYLSLYHKPGTKIKFRVLRNRKPIEIALVY